MKKSKGRKLRFEGDESSGEGISPVRIHTLDQLLDFFDVDRDEWAVKEWECTSWEQGTKTGKKGSEKVVVTPLYRIRARFNRRHEWLELQSLAEAAAGRLAGVRPPRCAKRKTKADLKLPPRMAILGLFDVHFGKLAWHRETGNKYNTDRAQADMLEAASGLLDLLDPLYHVEELVVPVGNDLINSDVMNPAGVPTTTAGTPQQDSCRWQRIYSAAFETLVRIIDQAASRYSSVRVPIVPGNHDVQKSYFLGHALEQTYREHKGVTIDNQPTTRKYLTYGKNLVGFGHGKDEKPAEIPQILALEAKKDWSRAEYRDFYFGHLHHKKERGISLPILADEIGGVRLRWLPAISGTDAWHQGKGFIGSRRAGELHIYDSECGWIGQLTHPLA
jgi:hypothetical protein